MFSLEDLQLYLPGFPERDPDCHLVRSDPAQDGTGEDQGKLLQALSEWFC
ncbi:hypothetical protein SCE1572_11775 [Sorangium cellulosum So0157-2]|uniref:Uncharacterized protein n=1 Tax=Sorangium cellulosum So0157-2 TaxID=1254432 RepID=S4XTA8_SORCE|nr:hypothetical protein SCE1572_11775 [Sorangium cellulosum So0157-2]